MHTLTRKHWPLLATICVYWATVIVLVLLSISRNQGHFVYPLDDTYIHMAIAKNAALHRVWGVTRYEFTSSTSSPLWTFLLAVTYLAFGVNDVSPLVLNLLFGTLTIVASYLILAKHIGSSSRSRILGILLLAVFVAPLPSLTVDGMEHVLHTLLTLCFVYVAARALSETTPQPLRSYAPLMILTPLVTTCRYEGLFAVFVVCVLFLAQKRIVHAAAVGAIALLPVVIYGIWSVAHGWYFLPNSILLKGSIPKLSLTGVLKLLIYDPLSRLQYSSHMLLLLIASLVVLLLLYLKDSRAPDNNGRRYANLIFVGTLLLHMQLARTGEFYRYEAYLVLLGIIIVGISIGGSLPRVPAWKISKQAIPRYVVAILLAAVVAFPFCTRALFSLKDTPEATSNIYEQQYQMGRFLRQFYQGRAIAVNDIGAVTYLADIHLLDLWGLGSLKPARLRMQKNYTAQDVAMLSKEHGVAIAIVYDQFLEEGKIGGRPSEWVRIGQWEISSNNVVVGDDIVSLYAVAPSASGELMQNLRQFQTELPASVKQYGEYTKE